MFVKEPKILPSAPLFMPHFTKIKMANRSNGIGDYVTMDASAAPPLTPPSS